MKKRLTSSLLALSLAFNTAPVLGVTQVFAQDEVDENLVNVDALTNEELDALIQAELEALENNGINTYSTYETEDGFKYTTSEDNTIKITGYNSDVLFPKGNDGSVTIPSSINEKSVTSIGEEAFSKCSDLVTIIIPSSVASIGIDAFYRCTSLTSITIPDSVTSIENTAFNNCTSLESINLPNNLTELGSGAFGACSSLKSIVIPDGVTEIKDSSFGKCTSLKSVTFGKNVESIGTTAFYGCDSLESITIPDSVTELGALAFSDCDNLAEVKIGSGVTYLGNSFAESGLVSIVIPDTVTQLGSSVSGSSTAASGLSYCTKLESVTLSNNIEWIGFRFFEDCTSLKTIVIPNGVETIVSRAFYNCSSLESITIPTTVTRIEGSVFYNCDSLTDVYYDGSESMWNAIAIVSNNDDALENATIHYGTVDTGSGNTGDGGNTGSGNNDGGNNGSGNNDIGIGENVLGTDDSGAPIAVSLTTTEPENPPSASSFNSYSSITNLFTFDLKTSDSSDYTGTVSIPLTNLDTSKRLALFESIDDGATWSEISMTLTAGAMATRTIDIIATAVGLTSSSMTISFNASSDAMYSIAYVPSTSTNTDTNDDYYYSGSSSSTTTTTTTNATINVPSTVTVTTADTSSSALSNAYAQARTNNSGYTATSSPISSFNLKNFPGGTVSIPVTLTNTSYSRVSVVQYSDDGTYIDTHGPFTVTNGAFTLTGLTQFSNFYVYGLTATSSGSSSSSSGSSYSSAVYYDSGSVRVNGSYITELRNVLVGELVNLSKITTVNGQTVTGWYYDSAMTNEISNTSQFVITSSIIADGIYAKTTGTTIVPDSYVDGSTNAGNITTTAPETTYAPSVVPSTVAKLLSKLF